VLVRRAEEALEGVDAALLVIDASSYARVEGRILEAEPGANRALSLHPQDRRIVEKLARTGVPCSVVLNKVDLVHDKQLLLPIGELLLNQVKPAQLFFVSATQKDGTADLLPWLASVAPEGPALFDTDIVSDQPVRFHVAEIIRERVFLLTHEEVPYATAVEIEKFDETTTPVTIFARINVEKPGQKAILIGHGGEMISKIRVQSKRRVELFLGHKVVLELHVSVVPDWSAGPGGLRRMGYE